MADPSPENMTISLPRELSDMLVRVATEDLNSFGETVAAALALYIGLSPAARLAVQAKMSGTDDTEIARMLGEVSASLVSTRRLA